MADELGGWFLAASHSGSLERYLETFGHTVGRDAERGRAGPGGRRVRARTWPPTASSTPRCGSRPSCTSSRAWRWTRWSRPCWRASGSAPSAAAETGRRIRIGCLLTAMRHAARSREIAELAVRVPRPRRGRLRHRRRRGRLPAHPAPGRVRVPAPAERALHHPRRRGVRAAVDLGGAAVVRRRPARARRAHRRRHHAGRRRHPAARPARRLRAGQAHPAGDVPDVQRAHRRGEVAGRPPDRPARRAAVPGHREHRQPADVRRVDDAAR